MDTPVARGGVSIESYWNVTERAERSCSGRRQPIRTRRGSRICTQSSHWRARDVGKKLGRGVELGVAKYDCCWLDRAKYASWPPTERLQWKKRFYTASLPSQTRVQMHQQYKMIIESTVVRLIEAATPQTTTSLVPRHQQHARLANAKLFSCGGGAAAHGP